VREVRRNISGQSKFAGLHSILFDMLSVVLSTELRHSDSVRNTKRYTATTALSKGSSLSHVECGKESITRNRIFQLIGLKVKDEKRSAMAASEPRRHNVHIYVKKAFQTRDISLAHNRVCRGSHGRAEHSLDGYDRMKAA
jgi:hypothetical protein